MAAEQLPHPSVCPDEYVAAQYFTNGLTDLGRRASHSLGHRALNEADLWNGGAIWFDIGQDMGRACLRAGTVEIINLADDESLLFSIDSETGQVSGIGLFGPNDVRALFRAVLNHASNFAFFPVENEA